MLGNDMILSRCHRVKVKPIELGASANYYVCTYCEKACDTFFCSKISEHEPIYEESQEEAD